MIFSGTYTLNTGKDWSISTPVGQFFYYFYLEDTKIINTKIEGRSIDTKNVWRKCKSYLFNFISAIANPRFFLVTVEISRSATGNHSPSEVPLEKRCNLLSTFKWVSRHVYVDDCVIPVIKCQRVSYSFQRWKMFGCMNKTSK